MDLIKSYIKPLILASTPTDYVMYISFTSGVFIANTTKDDTNTFTLFADNIIMVNDSLRGYCLSTSTGFYGLRLASPVQYTYCPSYTYSVWVKITGSLSTSHNNGIVGDYFQSGGSFYLYWDTAGVLTATHGSSYNTDVITGSTFSTLNTWSHITISYNNSSLLMTMYINGISIASKTKSSSWTGFGSSIGGAMTFGYARFPITAYGYTGYMDNMRLYNRTLSQSEITNIYNYELF